MREDKNAATGRGARGFGLLMSGFVVAALAVFFGLIGAILLWWLILFTFYMYGYMYGY